MSRRWVVAFWISWSLAVACGGEGTSRPPIHGDGDGDGDADADAGDAGAPDAATYCIDFDGDGYGPLCPAGEDCNDEDAASWDDCSVCPVGGVKEGCACLGTEAPSECHTALYENERGRLVCDRGLRSCEEVAGAEQPGTFVWGACVVDAQL